MLFRIRITIGLYIRIGSALKLWIPIRNMQFRIWIHGSKNRSQKIKIKKSFRFEGLMDLSEGFEVLPEIESASFKGTQD
jgi:hypothetical protein